MSYYIIDMINFVLIFLLLDFINGVLGNFLGKRLKNGLFTVLVIIITALVICIPFCFFTAAKTALLIAAVLAFILIIGSRIFAGKCMAYSDIEAGKEERFANRKVMIMVPHQDDDINLAGGVIEEYLKHGSQVYVVFSTNGDGDERYDMSKMGFIRISEAVKALAVLGVPEENIVFLGYGDGWEKGGAHIYNARKGEVVNSRAGRTETYGSKAHPAFHDNNSYTYSNYYNDIKQVILEHKPDTIFCIDYDTHNEHRALSMTFEKAMGEILKETAYQPEIYKGYAYRTAWNAPDDFYGSVNILSTADHRAEDDVVLYDWNRRERFPIDINSVSRALSKSKLYRALAAYSSQKAVISAGRIINGDKVFWRRRTDSLLYNAQIYVSSGDKSKLTDFMLLDCADLINRGDMPYDGVWRPDKDDKEKTVRVAFPCDTYIDSVVLYDSPSPDESITNALIRFDDGSCVPTGKLHPGGTTVEVKKTARSFDIVIESSEGESCGLTEIEAFSGTRSVPALYKLTDDNGSFAYDYVISKGANQVFKIYQNTNPDVNYADFIVTCNKKSCGAVIRDNRVIVTCPKGRKCRVLLRLKNNGICDRILVRNPLKITRKLLMFWQKTNLNKSYAHRIFLSLSRT